MSRVPPSREAVDHRSEIQLRIRAGSLEELLAEAGRGLAEIQLQGGSATPGGPWRPIEVTAPDRAALLVEWLNELIYLAETERWIPLEFRVEEATAREARARARGATVDRAPGLVKAATFHGLRVEEIPGGLEGEVVLDI